MSTYPLEDEGNMTVSGPRNPEEEAQCFMDPLGILEANIMSFGHNTPTHLLNFSKSCQF